MDERIQHLEEVCSCAFSVDLMLEKLLQPVTKDDEGDDELRDVVLPPLIVSLARLLSARFRRAASQAIEEDGPALAGAGSAAAATGVIARLGARLGRELAAATSDDMGRAIESMYHSSKLSAAQQLGVRPRLGPADNAVLTWMRAAYPWWIGDYHSQVLAKQIQEIANRVIIQGGMSGKEAADLVRNQLTRLYGLGKGAPSPVKVPRSYRGQPDQYWLGLANHAATTARVFARLAAMRDAEVTTYVIRSAGDERVCGLCRFMDGKEFSVAEGERFRDLVTKSASPEEYKRIAGWLKLGQAQSIFSAKGSAGLAEAGLLLPAYHFLCRCDIEAKL